MCVCAHPLPRGYNEGELSELLCNVPPVHSGGQGQPKVTQIISPVLLSFHSGHPSVATESPWRPLKYPSSNSTHLQHGHAQEGHRDPEIEQNMLNAAVERLKAY